MDRETADVTKRYVKKVKKAYPDARAFLFGSRARTDHWVTSDFDLLVISKKFADKSTGKRIGDLLKLWTFHRDLDVICLTPDEFNRRKKTSSLLKLIAHDGIEVT